MKEADIRPAALHDEYIRLSAMDANLIFTSSERKSINCPGCGGSASLPAFVKFGFSFAECSSCATLFQSPRPLESDFENFYLKSASADFWATTFFPQVAESRRSLIIRPRAERISLICEQRGLKAGRVIDAGAGTGLFLEEWKRLHPAAHTAGVEPGPALAESCRKKGIEVLQATVEKAGAWKETADLVTCFEVFEHVFDPLAFVEALKQLVKPGGLLVLTTLGVDGFDIQTLWSESKSISPPHHINFLSVKGLNQLFRRAGFGDIEIFTPGQLDVDIVINYMKAHPDFTPPRFFEKIISQGEPALKNFQKYLADNQLSSHVWVVAKKQEGII